MFTIPNQINDLVNPDTDRRERAKRDLVAKGAASIDDLLRALPTANDHSRWKILQVLTEIGDARAVPGFIDCLYSNSSAIQAVAAQFLGNIGANQAVEPMLEVLTSGKNVNAHVWIIHALGKIGDQRAIVPLVRIMHQTDSSTIRYTAIEALGHLGDERVLEDILRYQNDPSHHVVERVQGAIQNLSRPQRV